MRLYLFLFLVSIAAHGSAQKSDTVRLSLNEHFAPQKKGGYYPAIAVQQNTQWVLYAVQPDTSFVLVMSFLDRKLKTRDGAFTVFQKGKKPWIIGAYRNNLADGTWAFFDDQGKVMQTGQMIQGQMTGDWTFSTEGQKRSVLHYKFQENLKIKPEEPLNGSFLALNNVSQLLEGPALYFHENGNVSDSGVYRNNRKHGPWVYYYKNGSLRGRGNYNNDSISGTWNWYREDGNPATVEQYRNNKLVSINCFDTEGKSTGNSCPVLQIPYPIGSFSNFALYAENNLFIPDTLKGVIEQGEVKIRVSISAAGKLASVKTLSATHPLLATEAELFFQSFQEWSPAIMHNMYTDYEQEYDLLFNRFR